jgi:hypothetical protein
MEAIQLELPLGPLETKRRPDPEVVRQERIASGRVRITEALYHLAGREEPGHPLHGRYTGLGQAFHGVMGQVLLETLLEEGEGALAANEIVKAFSDSDE